MLELLYDFFYDNLFADFVDSGNHDVLLDYFFKTNGQGGELTLLEYLSFILSLISVIFIVVLCCLFIYRIIRLLSRLFSGGTL